MPQKTFGLKPGEEKPSTGTDHPENNAPEPKPEAEVDALESEIDNALKGGDDQDDDTGIEDQGDDTVVLPKAKLEKMRTDSKNYKNGLLSTKSKLKGLKKRLLPAAAPTKEDKPNEGKAPIDPNRPVTVGDLEEVNRKKVIKMVESGKVAAASGEVPPEVVKDLDEHWVDIMSFYTPRRGTETVEDIIDDLLDAQTLFRARNPVQKKDGDDEAAAELAGESGSPTSTATGGKPTEGKPLLPKNTSPKEWYPTKKK